MPTRLLIFLLVVVTDVSAADPPELNTRLHAFYYPWYGNPETDGSFIHWDHNVAVRDGAPHQFPGGDDIGADFYPALGCYSSNDPALVSAHMKQFCRARIGVISVSSWGKGSFTDRTLDLLFAQAEKHGVKINFHIEPHLGNVRRDIAGTRASIVDLIDRYGESPALYRDPERGNRPVFYIYDSYLSKSSGWATILSPSAENTIRGTKHDAIVIGLWVHQNEGDFFLTGHFDGFYTYFASNGFRYGCSWKNWRSLAAWAKKHDKLFVPCVAPGYIDTRIRPWNGGNTRHRENGAYYDRSFQHAIDVRPTYIGITSFNEWHEGSQIEPAIKKKVGDYKYQDYEDRDPAWYLDRTAHWATKY